MIKLSFYSKEVYGKTMYYFSKNSDRALWYNLTGKKTLTKKDIDNLTMLTGVSLERTFEAED